jgi:thiol-disulfide isomerase/thioredoxin
MLSRRLLTGLTLATGLWTNGVTTANAADDNLEKALGFAPFQQDVEYDRPTPAEVENCKLNPLSSTKASGWSITNQAGQLLRRFVDTNADQSLDQWCYYANGVEVYRDIDGDFDGKPDQYRWLGTAGTRWGIDENEDGVVDSWKQISAEEVTAEVVAAIQQRDKAKFQAILLTTADIAAIGVGPEQSEQMGERIKDAITDFAEVAKRQTELTPTAKWMYFGGSRPSVIPAGTQGSKRDLLIYDNVSAIVDDGGKHAQVAIGTLVRVNDAWKLLDLPATLVDAEAASGYFFQASMKLRPEVGNNAPDQSSADLRKWIDELERIDAQLETVSPKAAAQLQTKRADVIVELIGQTKGENRSIWIRQFADTVAAAVQSGTYPAGIKRLSSFYDTLAGDPNAKNDLAYVKFQVISAEFASALSGADVDYAKVQDAHQQKLEAFIDDFPTSPDTTDAMMQLGLTEEFAGNTQKALTWYRRVADDFPQASHSAKAVGAANRLESVGRAFPISGKTVDGKTFNLSELRGKVVVVHSWAGWCDLCKEDIDALKRTQIKYARKGLAVVGINLDDTVVKAKTSVAEVQATWTQLHDTGLDSALANELGIVTLPTMFLIDASGKVARQSLHISELDAELQKLLK